MTRFIYTQKQKQILMKRTLIMYLNQSIPHTYSYIKYTKNVGKSSDWIVDSVIDHNINISKHNPLKDHPRKGLINIQDIDDNQCFKWFLVTYLHSTDRNTAKITKVRNYFDKNLILKT